MADPDPERPISESPKHARKQLDLVAPRNRRHAPSRKMGLCTIYKSQPGNGGLLAGSVCSRAQRLAGNLLRATRLRSRAPQVGVAPLGPGSFQRILGRPGEGAGIAP